MAVPVVGETVSGLPINNPRSNYITDASVQETVVRSDVDETGLLIATPLLAASWTEAPDRSYTDFKVQEGVPWHQGFGNLTAEDIVWTFNQVNPSVTPDVVHSTSSELNGAVEGALELIDSSTFRAWWKGPVDSSYHTGFGHYGEGIGVHSKAAFDRMGAAWMFDNVIGTGPFEMEDWTPGRHMITTAVVDHWLRTPNVQRVRYLEVPEASVRRAMMEARQAQIGEIAAKDRPTMVERGFAMASSGGTGNMALIFGGNYWTKTHPTSGAMLQRELDDSIPWVGNPDDPASMERARKVRAALSMTLDRKGINDAVYSGLGMPSYIGGLSTDDSVWRANAGKWTIPYDPDTARQLLKDAGYPDGFTVEFYSSSGTGTQIAQILMATWKAELDVDTNLKTTPYSQHRPNYINRTDRWLSYRSGWAALPSTWGGEWYLGSAQSAEDGRPSGGFNAGTEIPQADAALKANRAAGSLSELQQITTDFFDYVSEQSLWPGTVEIRTLAVFDPDAIEDWFMYPMSGANLAGARNLEFVILTASFLRQ